MSAAPEVDSGEVFRRYFAVWSSGDTATLGDLLTADYVGHPASGDRDIEGLKQRIAAFHSAYPEISFEIEAQLVSGDMAATRMSASGTTLTGMPVRLVGLNICRCEGGRVAEEWPVWEVAG